MGKAKKLAAAGALVIGAKVAAVCGAGAVVSNWLDELFDSGRMVSAMWKASPAACSGSNVHCVMPSRSRRSTKMRPPWSRRRETQPVSVTSSPMLAARGSPQVRVCME